MSAVKRYRKKPVVIEAMRWDGTEVGAIEIVRWIRRTGTRNARYTYDPEYIPGPGRGITTITDRIEIETLEGTMRAMPGDFIILGVSNEHYPCKPDIFEATYEAEETA